MVLRPSETHFFKKKSLLIALF